MWTCLLLVERLLLLSRNDLPQAGPNLLVSSIFELRCSTLLFKPSPYKHDPVRLLLVVLIGDCAQNRISSRSRSTSALSAPGTSFPVPFLKTERIPSQIGRAHV